MNIDLALGWQITVERPGGAAPQVYNVAISDDQLAMEAVKRALQDAKGACNGKAFLTATRAGGKISLENRSGPRAQSVRHTPQKAL